MIQSMTKQEREQPELLAKSPSRRWVGAECCTALRTSSGCAHGLRCGCRARTFRRRCATRWCLLDGDPSWYHSLPTRCPRWLQLTCLLPLACLAHRRRISRGSGRTEEQVGNFTTEQLPA